MNKKLKIAAHLGFLSIALPLSVLSCERKAKPTNNKEVIEANIRAEANKLFPQIRFEYKKDKSEVFAKDVLVDDLLALNADDNFKVVDIKLSSFGNILKIKYSLQYKDSNLIYENETFYEIDGFKKEEKIEEIPSNFNAKILYELNTDLNNLKLNFVGNKEEITAQEVQDEHLDFSGLQNNNHQAVIESKQVVGNKLILVVKLKSKIYDLFSKTKTFIIENFKNVDDSPSSNRAKIKIIGDNYFKNKYSKVIIYYDVPEELEGAKFDWYLNGNIFKENSEPALKLSAEETLEDSKVYLKITYQEDGETKEIQTNTITVNKYTSPEERIANELQKIVVEFNGDKSTVLAKDVNISDFTYSNFDANKYQIISVKKTLKGRNLNLSLKLRDKENKIRSETRTFEIDGFLEELPTPITNSLANTSISVENAGDFGNQTSLLISYNGPQNNDNLTFKWYLNDILLRSANESHLSLKSNQAYKDSAVTLKILYTENNVAKEYQTNSVSVKRYVSPREKIETELKKVIVEYTGDKQTLRAQDVNLDDFRFSNFDSNKYEARAVRKIGRGETLNLAVILRDKATNLESFSKIFEITGFLENLPTPITDTLVNTTISVNNEGDFGDDTSLTVTYDGPQKTDALTFEWYKNNAVFKTTDSNVLTLLSSEVPRDSSIYLKVLYNENNEDKEYKTNLVYIKKYVSPERKLAKELQKVNVEYNGNKQTLRAQDVDLNNLTYSNFDQEKYEVTSVEKSGEGQILTLSVKLRNKQTGLESEAKIFKIKGFLEKLPTPIADKLVGTIISAPNNGDFGDDTTLTISYNGPADTDGFAFNWYKDGLPLRTTTDKTLVLQSTEVDKDINIQLKVTYRENGETKDYLTNTLSIKKYKTPQERLELALQNLEADYSGDKLTLRAQDANIDHFRYSNYDNIKYRVMPISKEGEGHTARLLVKLVDDRNNLQSEVKVIEITGFLEQLPTRTTDKLNNSQLSVNNNGVFENANYQINVTLLGVSDQDTLRFKWYKNNTFYRETVINTIPLFVNDITEDSTFYVEVIYNENGEQKTFTSQQNVTVYRYISPEEKIATELAKVQATYTKDKNVLRAQDVDLKDIEYSGFDNNLYEITDVVRSGTGRTLNLSLKLKNKETNLKSQSKSLDITGFLEKLDTPIADSLVGTNIQVENSGNFGDDSTLDVTYNAPERTEGLTFKWFKNGQFLRTTSGNVLTLDGDEVNQNSEIYLIVAFEENKELVEFKTNSVNVNRYVPESEKIAAELQKVSVDYNGNKQELRAQDVEIGNLRYTGFDANKYDVTAVQLSGEGRVLNVSLKLANKNSGLESEAKTFSIEGFLEVLPTPIENSLRDTQISVPNSGDFGDSTTLSVTYNAPQNTSGLTYQWYKDDQPFRITNNNVLTLSSTDVPADSTIYLKVLFEENKEHREYQTNTVNIKRYVSPEEKIASELAKVAVTYTGNKSQKIAQDADENSISYSGFNSTKYRLVKLPKSGSGSTLLVNFKLQEISSGLFSEERQISITGFLDRYPTPITDKLEANSISAENEGRFENWDSSLRLSFSLRENEHNFTYTWYKNDQAVANSNSVDLTVNASSITEDSTYYLSVSYLENNVRKTFKSNEVTVYKFITLKERIDIDVDNLEATYAGNKDRISPQNAKTSAIQYTNYDSKKYDVILVSSEHDETNLILKVKLRYKDYDIESKERTITISGFASQLLDSITTLLSRTSIEASNNGYFDDENGKIKISFQSTINIEGITYQWYQANQPKYKSTGDHIYVNRDEIIRDTEFYLLVSYTENGQVKTHKSNVITIKNTNPLSRFKLGSLNDGLIIDGSTQIYLRRYQASTDSGLYVQWFKDDKLVSDQYQNALTVREDGEYYALIIDQNSVKWKTNTVKVSRLQRLNKDESFAANLNEELSITTTSSKILGYENRTPVTDLYQTTLLEQYQASGFRYPGYNFNYEGNRNGNSFITHNSQRINISNLLMNERVKEQPNYKYNDANWIKSEIANNRLKKHPFALNWYVENVTDSTQAVIKKFELNSNILGYNTSGLYAAAGEVIEIQFDESTYDLYRRNYQRNNSVLNIDFVINKSYWDNRGFNDSGRISNRYPYLISQFSFRFNEINSERKIKIGSPFGGAISFNIKSQIYDRGKPQSINFTVRKAVQTVEYIHNQTTKEDWENQLKDFKNKKITAPIFSLQTTYSSIWLPLTHVGRIAGVNVDNMVYPKEVINKWEDFYQTSYLWNDYTGKKMSLNYNDDIWGGAAAWGGGDFSLYAPVSWGAGYLTGAHDFNFSNWGNYHEVNHNFQNHQDPFNIKDHGWTNIPSLIDLSFINDGTRHRNITNYDGSFSSGWARLANLSSIIRHDRSWYGFYGALIYTFGPINFVEYTKASDRAGKWNQGVKTTKFLSDYFDFDLDYTMRTFTWLVQRSAGNNFKRALPPIRDGHIDATDKINEVNGQIATLRNTISELDQRIQEAERALQTNPNDEEKRADLQLATRLKNERTTELNEKLRLKQSYEDRSFFGQDERDIVAMKQKMAIDIVGNIYAVGSYRYIPYKNKYEYTSDTMPAFQVPAGSPYVFDFSKGVTSLNNNFRFRGIKFEPTSKLGGRLRLDSQNPKKLIYEANMDFIDQIDEFDVDIIPDDFPGKPQNYIPAYKYKIKVRNIVNKPEVYLYDAFPANQNPSNIDQVLNIVNNARDNYFVIADEGNGHINHIRNDKRLAVQKMKFLAPESGQFDFMAVVDDYISIEVDGRKIGERNSYIGNETRIASYTFEKDHIYNITVNYYNSGGGSSFGSRLKKGDKYYSYYDYSLPGGLDTSNLSLEKIKEYLHDPKYKYKRRYKEYDPRFKGEYSKYIFTKQPQPTYTNQLLSRYTPYSTKWTTVDKMVDNNYDSYFETWDTSEIKYKWIFDKPVTTNYLEVSRKDYPSKIAYVPNYYKITVLDVHGNTYTVFDGIADVNGYTRLQFKVPFNRLVTAKEITVHGIRQNPDRLGLVIVDMRFGLQSTKENYILPVTNKNIEYYGHWSFHKSDSDTGQSPINNKYITTNNASDYLTFELDKPNFSIYGKVAPNQGKFDVYLDGNLIGEDISLSASHTDFNAELFTHIGKENDDDDDSDKKYTVKIVSKENKPIILNYFSYQRTK